MKVVKRIAFKSKNRRQTILILKEDDGERVFFLLITKRLHDFKTRKILENEMIFSPETFLAVHDLFNMTIRDDSVIKELILDAIITVKHTKVKVTTYENPDFYVVKHKNQ